MHTTFTPAREPIVRAASGRSGAAWDRRYGKHPFTGPSLQDSSWSRLTGLEQRVLSLLDNQPRRCGVSVINAATASRVLGCTPLALADALDQLHDDRQVFYASFVYPRVRTSRAPDHTGTEAPPERRWYALKPHGQSGDMPMGCALELAADIARRDSGT